VSITAAVHAHGVPILAQLNHNGGQASGHVLATAGVGAEPGAGPAVPRGAQGEQALADGQCDLVVLDTHDDEPAAADGGGGPVTGARP
jgi:hypothetical protein